MLSKIISIICTLISISVLCNVMFNRNLYYIEHYMLPETQEENPSDINITPQFNSQKPDSSIKLYSKSCCLIDAGSGRILYSKDADTPLPMASTTKIMTCILALELGDPDSVVNVSSYAASMPDVQLNICEGEQYILKDLLYSLMLESHNDTAVAIAEHIGGSKEGFAQLMNNKASELGLSSTHFVTPNGLDAEGHYTTARELCLITAYAINNPEFLKIISTDSYTFTDVSKKRTFSVYNHDSFLKMYDGALGVKTGFTGDAGYCFAGAARRGDITLTSAVLACGWPPHKSYKWSDTTALMDYGFNNFNYYTLLSGTYSSNEASDAIKLNPVIVTNEHGMSPGSKKSVNIKFDAECSVLLCSDDNARLTLNIPKQINLPVAEGEIIGTASLYVNDEIINEYPVYSSESVENASPTDYMYRLFSLFLYQH